MELNNLKIKYITEEEFISYIDWLTRLKNPINNLLRVCDKILIKNCLEPKFSTKKAEDMSLFKKFEIAHIIWDKSIKNLLKDKKYPTGNNLKDFLIFEEQQTFCENFLLQQIAKLEYENEISKNSYSSLRQKLFLPIDDLIGYFQEKSYTQNFLLRLFEKKNSTLQPSELFNYKSKFASIKTLFLVEGITEEKILPKFADLKGINFEENGIKLKAVGGKTHILKYYADVRNLFKIPICILLDADGVDILYELNSILKSKDKVYLINNGEIEDILPHSLIQKSINNYYSSLGTISLLDLKQALPMTKILHNLYKEKGLGEFHKAKFATILQENINSPDDLSGEIEKIFDFLIQNK